MLNIQPNVTKESAADNTALFACGRLSEARRWFTHRGWLVLPKTERGRRILKWGAIHAWMAGPADPKGSVRRWCRRWAPWLTSAELDKIVANTKKSNKRWSADQSATVLAITVRDRTALGFRFLGASDDPDYKSRHAMAKEKAAARARKSRAARSTGKRGRPALELSIEDRLARGRAQEAERARRYRASRKNASRHIIEIGSVTEFSVTEDKHSLVPNEIAATMPPAKAVGTHSKSIWYEGVDCVAVVGDDRKRFKTRFPTSMRLSRQARAYALAACFEPAKVDRMFEMFRDCNIGMGSWSRDWDAVWRNWVDREVDIHNEAHDKAKARAYAMRVAA